MAVPTQLSDLSATAASNSPAGGDTVGTTMDDYIRAIQSIIVRISAGTDALATPAIGAATGTSLVLSGLATVNGAFTSLGLDDNATAVALTLSGSGANSITIANSATNPTIGTSGGDLFLVPAGDIGLRIAAIVGTVANYLAAIPSATIDPLLSSNTGSIFLGGAAGNEEVRVVNTGASTRYITLTGSNGGNPTIGTSGGGLAIGTTLLCAAGVQAKSATATPAGGAVGFYMGSDSIGIYFGSGAPTATAAKGSLYLRSDGTTTNNRMYVNTDGSTTWTAVTTAA